MVIVDSSKTIHTSPPIIPRKTECGDVLQNHRPYILGLSVLRTEVCAIYKNYL